MPRRSERPRRVAQDREGPLLIEGPVEFELQDGTVVSSDRFTVAVCQCRRSRTYPWCDTSHRRRSRPRPEDGRRTDVPGGAGDVPGTRDGKKPGDGSGERDETERPES